MLLSRCISSHPVQPTKKKHEKRPSRLESHPKPTNTKHTAVPPTPTPESTFDSESAAPALALACEDAEPARVDIDALPGPENVRDTPGLPSRDMLRDIDIAPTSLVPAGAAGGHRYRNRNRNRNREAEPKPRRPCHMPKRTKWPKLIARVLILTLTFVHIHVIPITHTRTRTHSRNRPRRVPDQASGARASDHAAVRFRHSLPDEVGPC